MFVVGVLLLLFVNDLVWWVLGDTGFVWGGCYFFIFFFGGGVFFVLFFVLFLFCLLAGWLVGWLAGWLVLFVPHMAEFYWLCAGE